MKRFLPLITSFVVFGILLLFFFFPGRYVFWAISILSDAQELLSMGYYAEANNTINKAKKVLMGKFKEIEDGFMIEVL